MGGAAGGTKSYSLLLEGLRHRENPDAGSVLFRREMPQITAEGGIWDDAEELYDRFGALSNQNTHSMTFPSGYEMTFAHMQYEKNRLSWKSSQIALLMFDQLEDFHERQFWYMFSRNRSAKCGFDPYIRGACNPVPADDETGGWLNKLIAWWWDPETGYAIPERSGVVRWFVRDEEVLRWADDPADLSDSDDPPTSFTFIPSTVEDNPILMQKNPGYLARLMALPLVERQQLRYGNWLIRPDAGSVFDRAWFRAVAELPNDAGGWVRYWDKAGSTKSWGKYTAGVLLGRRPNGDTVIADVCRGKWKARDREKTILDKAKSDAKQFGKTAVQVWVEQEPGSGGMESAETTIRNLAGYVVRADRPTGDKLTRALPLSAQVEARNVYLVNGSWNEEFLLEAHRFDGRGGVMDQIDAASGAYNKCTLGPLPVRVIELTGF